MEALIANTIIYSNALLSAVFGLTYLFKSSFIRYHRAALEKNWYDLEYRTQTLLLALMRAVSGGALLFTFIITILQYQFNKSKFDWIPLTILVSTLIFSGCSIYAMALVRIKTKGKPPLIFVIINVMIAFIGYYLNIKRIH